MTVADAAPIATIYNGYVTTSTSTFDMVPRSVEDQRAWIEQRTGALGALVAVDLENDEIVGFASLSPFRARPAYRTSVENSVYVAEQHHGRGIGVLLMEAVIQMARDLGYHAMFARISDSSSASRSLHTKLGFFEVGVEREVGRKFNRWLDVTVMQLLL